MHIIRLNIIGFLLLIGSWVTLYGQPKKFEELKLLQEEQKKWDFEELKMHRYDPQNLEFYLPEPRVTFLDYMNVGGNYSNSDDANVYRRFTLIVDPMDQYRFLKRNFTDNPHAIYYRLVLLLKGKASDNEIDIKRTLSTALTQKKEEDVPELALLNMWMKERDDFNSRNNLSVHYQSYLQSYNHLFLSIMANMRKGGYGRSTIINDSGLNDYCIISIYNSLIFLQQKMGSPSVIDMELETIAKEKIKGVRTDYPISQTVAFTKLMEGQDVEEIEEHSNNYEEFSPFWIVLGKKYEAVGNTRKAKKAYETVVNNKLTQQYIAQYYLNRLEEAGNNFAPMVDNLREKYKIIANQNFAPAQYRLAKSYELESNPNNSFEAYSWFKKAIDQNYMPALYLFFQILSSKQSEDDTPVTPFGKSSKDILRDLKDRLKTWDSEGAYTKQIDDLEAKDNKTDGRVEHKETFTQVLSQPDLDPKQLYEQEKYDDIIIKAQETRYKMNLDFQFYAGLVLENQRVDLNAAKGFYQKILNDINANEELKGKTNNRLGRVAEKEAQSDNTNFTLLKTKEAINFYKKAIELHNVTAYNNLGALYETCAKDVQTAQRMCDIKSDGNKNLKVVAIEKAEEQYRLGDEAGSIEATLNLARILVSKGQPTEVKRLSCKVINYAGVEQEYKNVANELLNVIKSKCE